MAGVFLCGFFDKRVYGMTSLFTRVAAKLASELSSLEAETAQRLESALYGSFDRKKLKETLDWFKNTFRVGISRTPTGQKQVKDDAQFFLRSLEWLFEDGVVPKANEDDFLIEPRVRYERFIKPNLPALVQYFSDTAEKKMPPTEIKIGSITFENRIGLSEKTLNEYAKAITSALSVTGWREKALQGGLDVVMAGPAEFNGTSSGKYRSAEDKLYVRATPKVLHRSEGYGSPSYVLVHELGHRYERKQHVPIDFDKPDWWTTPYSRKEGEAFAELFALGHFGIKSSFADKLDKFESVMM